MVFKLQWYLGRRWWDLRSAIMGNSTLLNSNDEAIAVHANAARRNNDYSLFRRFRQKYILISSRWERFFSIAWSPYDSVCPSEFPTYTVYTVRWHELTPEVCIHRRDVESTWCGRGSLTVACKIPRLLGGQSYIVLLALHKQPQNFVAFGVAALNHISRTVEWVAQTS